MRRGAVQQLARQILVPFLAESARGRKWEAIPPQPAAAAAAAATVNEGEVALAVERAEDKGLASERVGDRGPLEVAAAAAAAATGSATATSVGGAEGGLDEEDDGFGCDIGTIGNFKKAKVHITDLLIKCCVVITTYLLHNSATVIGSKFNRILRMCLGVTFV